MLNFVLDNSKKNLAASIENIFDSAITITLKIELTF